MITLIALLLVVKMCDKIELLRIMIYVICIYIFGRFVKKLSLNNGKRTVPDVQTEF